MHVVQISPFFTPNIGGVETHLDDLVGELDKKDIRVTVLTYSPLFGDLYAPKLESRGKNIRIIRYSWFRGIFYKLEKYPLLDFLYLTPWLLLNSLFYFIKHHKQIDVIHVHGLNAAFIGSFLKILFKLPLVISTHTTYNVKKNSLLAKLILFCLCSADCFLALSELSKKELIEFGIHVNKIFVYKYWVNLDSFSPEYSDLYDFGSGANNKSIISFVGRIMLKKGVLEFINCASIDTNPANFYCIFGTGDIDNIVKRRISKMRNIGFFGKQSNKYMPRVYASSSIVVVPSVYDEGFGRVILEALACGTPVIGSNRGGIPEAMDNSVGKLIDVTPKNILEGIKEILDREDYAELRKKCRSYAEKHYSNKNVDLFINTYNKLAKNGKSE